MTYLELSEDDAGVNPLDVIETVIMNNDWTFERTAPHELSVQVPGRWCDYSLYFAWSEEVSAVHFTCALDMRVPADRRSTINDLLATINERLWLGHFGVWEDEGLPMFRHAVLLRGTDGVSLGQMEDMLEVALTECDRFYPSFQYVIWAGKTAKEAVEASLIDTVGEA